MRSEIPIDRGPWGGWIDVPDPIVGSGIGPWQELSHVITEDLSRSPAFPPPAFVKLESLPMDTANVTEIKMAVHHGTHVDAPSHFYADGATIDAVPLDRLVGEGVIWAVPLEAGEVVEVEHLEAQRPEMRAGDIVVINTRSYPHINTPRYADAPSLSPEAARWLVARGVKLVGIDAATPDLPAHRRPEGFDWPVHQVLLGGGVLVAEHVTNLDALSGMRVEFVFAALPVAGADGGPARVLAREVPA